MRIPCLLALPLLFSCSGDPSIASGTSASEAGNALVQVRTNSGGIAAGVLVTVYPALSLPDTVSNRPTWSGRTDENGIARPVLTTGDWCVVARSGAASFRQFLSPTTTILDTLRPDATLSGVTPGARWALLPGLGRTVRCDISGAWRIDSLPSGFSQVDLVTSQGVVAHRAWLAPGQSLQVPTTTSGWLTAPPQDSFQVDRSSSSGTLDSMFAIWTVNSGSPLWSLPPGETPTFALRDTTGRNVTSVHPLSWDRSTRQGRLAVPLPSPLEGGKILRFQVSPIDSAPSSASRTPSLLAGLPAEAPASLLPDTGAFTFAASVVLPAQGGPVNVLNWDYPALFHDSGATIEWHPDDQTLRVMLGSDLVPAQSYHASPGRNTFVLRWTTTGIEFLATGGASYNVLGPGSPDRRHWPRPVLGGGAIHAMEVFSRPGDLTQGWALGILETWK